MIFRTPKAVIVYKHPPLIVRRDITLVLNSPSKWSEEPLLALLWKRCGYLLTEVRLRETYRSPKGWMAHNYELYFQVGPGLVSPDRYEINKLVASIEDDCITQLDVDLRGSTHRNRKLAEPEPMFGTHLREAYQVLKPVWLKFLKALTKRRDRAGFPASGKAKSTSPS